MDPTVVAASIPPIWPFGGRDFVQYWSAFQLLMQGQNPYDSVEMMRVQQGIGFPGELPVLMWNPPWLLLLLAPILWLDFEHATSAWILVNVLLLVAIPFILGARVNATCPLGRFAFYLSLLLLYLPVLDSIRSGQLGVLLAFGVALVIRGISTGKGLTAGVGLALLSVKPHLAALVVLAALCRVRREPIVPRICLCGLLLLLACVASVVTLRGAILWEWLAAISTTPQVGVPLLQWRTDTVTSLLRELHRMYLPSPGDYLVYAVPSVFVGALWLLSVMKPRLPTLSLVLIVTLLGPIFAPYGWVSDYSIAMPGLFYLFLIASSAAFKRAAWVYFGASAVSLPFFFLSSAAHPYLNVFPLLLLPVMKILLPQDS